MQDGTAERRRRIIMETTGATEAQMLEAEARAADFGRRLDAKSMELYGSPFDRLTDLDALRVRSEAAREDARKQACQSKRGPVS